MGTPFVLGIRSNVGAPLRSLVMETFLTMVSQSPHLARPIALNLDPSFLFRTRQGKSPKDDPAYRFGASFAAADLPVLNTAESREFLEAASKPNQAALTEGRVLLLFLGEETVVKDSAAIDENCVFVRNTAGTESFLYGVMRPDPSESSPVPGKIVVVGEPRIEKAAGFYLAAVEELAVLGLPREGFSFAGHLSFDADESVLALSYQKTLLEAFPKGVTHGQIKAITKRLGLPDATKDQVSQGARMTALKALAGRG